MAWLDAFEDATRNSIPATLVRPPDSERGGATAAELGLPLEMEAEGPLVSVVVPTYRDAYCLPEAVQSVGAQTHRNIELILVDSSGMGWVESLADAREWIRYEFHPPDTVAAARNTGIEAANGEYVALLDADDYWHPEKLAKQLPELRAGANVSFTDNYRLNLRDCAAPTVTYRGETFERRETAYLDALGERFAHTSTLVFRRSCLDDRPFDQSFTVQEDRLLVIEFFKQHPPVHVAEPLAVRRHRPDSLTDRTARRQKYHSRLDRVELLAERHPEIAVRTGRLHAQTEYRTGLWYLKQGDSRAARSHLHRCLGYQPTHPKGLLLFCVALLPTKSNTALQILRGFRRRVVPDSRGRAAVQIANRIE